MSSNINPAVSQLGWRYWIMDNRARVYLLWAAIVASGYLLLHFDPDDSHILGWAAASALAFGYMLYVMPMKVPKMKAIFASWLIPISIGFTLTVLAFENKNFLPLIPYLGVVWASVQATGFAFNGLVDPPSRWYWFAVLINVLLAVALLGIPALLGVQYALLAVVSTWAMLNLWLFRSTDL